MFHSIHLPATFINSDNLLTLPKMFPFCAWLYASNTSHVSVLNYLEGISSRQVVLYITVNMQPYNVHPQSSSSPAFSTAFTVAATLANPYSVYPSNYTQRQTTVEGYTISSTYTPSLSPPSVAPRRDRATQPNSRPHSTNAQSWYQPGNNKCSYPGCNFSGSFKALEIHRMDRHLIFPPGWERKKNKSDWDADPSLKGLV